MPPVVQLSSGEVRRLTGANAPVIGLSSTRRVAGGDAVPCGVSTCHVHRRSRRATRSNAAFHRIRDQAHAAGGKVRSRGSAPTTCGICGLGHAQRAARRRPAWDHHTWHRGVERAPRGADMTPAAGIAVAVDLGDCEARFRALVPPIGQRSRVCFRALSAESRFHRFNSAHTELSDKELASLSTWTIGIDSPGLRRCPVTG